MFFLCIRERMTRGPVVIMAQKHRVRSDSKARQILARLRRRQLDWALVGNVAESARMARRVDRVRRVAGDEPAA